MHSPIKAKWHVNTTNYIMFAQFICLHISLCVSHCIFIHVLDISTSCSSAARSKVPNKSIPLAPSHFRHRGGEKIRGRQEDLLLLGTKDAQHEVVAVAEVPVLDSAGGVVNHEGIQKLLFDLENKTRSFLDQTWRTQK